MFDTIEFPREIICNVCGEAHSSTQTKQFNNILANYQVGEILPGRIHTGLLEEEIICSHQKLNDENVKTSYDQKVYLVIWHHIYIDIIEDVIEGERILSNFGLGELLFLYEKQYQKRINYETKYNRLRTYARVFSDYLAMSDDKKLKYKNKEKGMFFSIPDWELIDVLDEEKPLIKLMEKLNEQEYTEKNLFS